MLPLPTHNCSSQWTIYYNLNFLFVLIVIGDKQRTLQSYFHYQMRGTNLSKNMWFTNPLSIWSSPGRHFLMTIISPQSPKSGLLIFIFSNLSEYPQKFSFSTIWFNFQKIFHFGASISFYHIINDTIFLYSIFQTIDFPCIILL